MAQGLRILSTGERRRQGPTLEHTCPFKRCVKRSFLLQQATLPLCFKEQSCVV